MHTISKVYFVNNFWIAYTCHINLLRSLDRRTSVIKQGKFCTNCDLFASLIVEHPIKLKPSRWYFRRKYQILKMLWLDFSDYVRCLLYTRKNKRRQILHSKWNSKNLRWHDFKRRSVNIQPSYPASWFILGSINGKINQYNNILSNIICTFWASYARRLVAGVNRKICQLLGGEVRSCEGWVDVWLGQRFQKYNFATSINKHQNVLFPK